MRIHWLADFRSDASSSKIWVLTWTLRYRARPLLPWFGNLANSSTQNIPPPTIKTHYLLHRSRTSTFWGRFRESVFWQVECSYFSSCHTRIQSIILFVHSAQGSSFPFFRKRLVRFIRSICLRHFYRACTRFKRRTKNCTTTLQISGARASMACSGGHGCYHHDLGHRGLSLRGGTYCSLVYSF